MSFTIGPGPRGGLTAQWGGRQLSSAYAPDREASVWADGLGAAPGSVVFVAGDPWGLAAAALNARGCRGVALVPGGAALPHLAEGVRAWSPDQGALESFLEEVWDDWGPDAVRWETWPAFERLAGDRALDWARRFRDAFRTYQGSWLTHRHFGRRLWKNAVRNTLDWTEPARLVPGSRPIVVAASGPSLEEGWELLARHRHRFDLWALPSSFEALVRRGLVPDAGVATDGGWYAREHLHRLAGTRVPLLAALTSAADPELTRRPVVFFSQGHPVEPVLLEGVGAQTPLVPSQGTVAVTALRLALAATSGPVFIAGLDLAHRNFRGHAGPHTVDRRAEACHSRHSPLETWWTTRTWDQAPVVLGGLRTSPAMLTYAGWLKTRWTPDVRVVRIAPTEVRWPTMAEASWEEAARLWTRAEGRPVRWEEASGWPPLADRNRRTAGALRRMARQAEESDQERWVTDAAATAVPEAVAEGWRARREGRESENLGPALARFIEALAEELGG